MDVSTGMVWGALALHALLAVLCVSHILLTRREPTASILWLQAVVFLPWVGPLLYAVGGLHRVKRAHALRGRRRADLRARYANVSLLESRRRRFEAQVPEHVRMREWTLGRLSGRSLLAGARVDVLENGEAAFAPMLAAIEQAKQTVHLGTYILDDDDVGRAFLDALRRAALRGVQVRLLYDAVGAYELEEGDLAAARRAGVQVAVSRPLNVWRWRRGLHFRNHRKILVVDGHLGFTGGMNISARHHALKTDNPHRCLDVHFRVTGPVVLQLQEVFVEDWHDATGQVLLDDSYFPEQQQCGPALARVITSSPAGDPERIQSVLFHALGSAQERVWIATPYFLPDGALQAALKAAVQRGVHVEVMVPGQVDSAFLGWAMQGVLPDLTSQGVHVFVREPPFNHSKVMLVDNAWSFIGSSNWDARSLKFNDECNVEVLDEDLVITLADWFARERVHCKRQDTWEFTQRPLWVRLTQRAAALFSPTL